jgi:glycosyltransferase involved in cell wall biosynthesis
MPVDTEDSGLSLEALRLSGLRVAREAILDLDPDLVHMSGPHVWNVPLLRTLKARGVPVVHTLHDLDPHSGSGYGAFLHLWNRRVMQTADHILVHAQTYYERIVGMGVPPEQVTSTPLMHLFIGGSWLGAWSDLTVPVEYQPWALFFGRLKEYKGIDYLMAACAMMDGGCESPGRVVIAGSGDLSKLWGGSLPDRLEVHNYLINDEDAMDLFSRCGLLVLPYVDATQSALIAAAYYFHKPVVVTRTGALPEYVEEDVTGRIVEPDHPASLSRCLEEMLADPERLAQMGAAGRAWYEAHRAEEEFALFDVYTRLAESRRSLVGSAPVARSGGML